MPQPSRVGDDGFKTGGDTCASSGAITWREIAMVLLANATDPSNQQPDVILESWDGDDSVRLLAGTCVFERFLAEAAERLPGLPPDWWHQGAERFRDECPTAVVVWTRY